MTDAERKQHMDKLMATIQPIGAYKDTFIEHCKENRKRISTGILAFDKALNGGLADELYIMGAETSTGKSAFLMSIAQSVAEAGTDVLYFALEMGKDEFIARAVSSISYEHHRKAEQDCLMTAGNVLYWTYDAELKNFTRMAYSQYEKYSDEYFERYGAHLNIIEGGINNLTVKDIANMAALYKKNSGNPVAVFIDYLQIIKADPEDRSQSDRKTKTDVTVTTLKALASQIGMPVVTISSISRSSYNGRITSSSFKESGDTEYTGGVLIGWNWSGVTDQNSEDERDKEKQVCKERGYRKMALEVLKYRNSERDTAIHLKYYPAYNFFEEDDGWETAKEEETPFDSKEKKTYNFK